MECLVDTRGPTGWRGSAGRPLWSFQIHFRGRARVVAEWHKLRVRAAKRFKHQTGRHPNEKQGHYDRDGCYPGNTRYSHKYLPASILIQGPSMEQVVFGRVNAKLACGTTPCYGVRTRVEFSYQKL